MYIQKEKPKENKNRPVANSVVQKKSNGKHSLGFVDNRSEAVAKRNLINIVVSGGRAVQPFPMTNNIQNHDTVQRLVTDVGTDFDAREHQTLQKHSVTEHNSLSSKLFTPESRQNRRPPMPSRFKGLRYTDG